MKLKYILMSIAALCATGAWADDINLTGWMAQLPDTAKVRNVSIPGTHDAATSSLTSILGDIANGKTQTYTIAEQFDKGVRAFDLRPREDMYIYHSSNTNVTMDQVFTTIKGKLEANSSEFAIFVIRFERDNPNESQTTQWKSRMKEIVEKYDDIVVEFSPSLRVENARGKIIILSRNEFESSKAAFLDAWSHWPNLNEQLNNYGTLKLDRTRIKVHIQDNFEYGSDVEVKKSGIQGMLDWASKNHDFPAWVINHASGYSGNLGVTSTFKTNANVMNPYIIQNMPEKGRIGIIMMDFAGDDTYSGQLLVNTVIEHNFGNFPQVVSYRVEESQTAWNKDGVTFEGILTLDMLGNGAIDTSAISVNLEPAGEGWLTATETKPEGVTDAEWKEWQEIEAAGHNVDGFWDPEYVEVELEEAEEGTYTINATLPCSGKYRVTLSSDEYYMIADVELPEEGDAAEGDTETEEPDNSFYLTVYPSILNSWTVVGEDEIPKFTYATNIFGLHVKKKDGELTMLYPFAEEDDLTIWKWESLAEAEIATSGVYLAETYVKVEPLTVEETPVTRAAAAEGHEATTKVDLSALANEDGTDAGTDHIVSIVLVKNGAATPVEANGKSTEYFTVTVDPDAEIPTAVEAIGMDADAETAVYNLNGFKVGASLEGLQPGIYIVRQGAKTAKILVK